MAKFTKTKEWLIDEYVIKNRPRQEIADECGLTVAGLKSLLAKWDIKKEKLNLPKETLEELINKKLAHDEIENILGIGQTTLYRYLRKYDLKILAEPRIQSRYDDSNDVLICQLYQLILSIYLNNFLYNLLSYQFFYYLLKFINYFFHYMYSFQFFQNKSFFQILK